MRVEVGHILLSVGAAAASPPQSPLSRPQKRERTHTPDEEANSQGTGVRNGAGSFGTSTFQESVCDAVKVALNAFLGSKGAANTIGCTVRADWGTRSVANKASANQRLHIEFQLLDLASGCGTLSFPLPRELNVSLPPETTDALVFSSYQPVKRSDGGINVTFPVFAEEREVLCAKGSSESTANATTAEMSPEEILVEKRILMIGAGGIGCEVIKALFLYGFRDIHMVDLDTIDATNLNRQFLFGPEDVGKTKVETARKAVLRWIPSDPCDAHMETTQRGGTSASKKVRSLLASPRNIVAWHANIKEDRFDTEFYNQFDIVVNGLDNVSARRHVNRMCMASNTPLIESGTMGYNGQVQPIERGLFECYDCLPKPADQKTFAVCTIHARPTTMVHCVHYAKELYSRLFGENSAAHSDDATEEGSAQPVDELGFLNQFMRTWMNCHQRTPATFSDPRNGFGASLGHFLFQTKIEELLKLKSSSTWTGTAPPPQPFNGELFSKDLHDCNKEHAVSDAPLTERSAAVLFRTSAETCALRLWSNSLKQGALPSESIPTTAKDVANETAKGHDDQQRSDVAPNVVPFRKEDDHAVDFVAAAANARAWSFHIPLVSVEEVRSIAGSIVPAIATTNAMAAAGVVQQAVAVLLQKEAVAKGLVETKGGDNINAAITRVGRFAYVAPPTMVYIRKAAQVRRRKVFLENNNSKSNDAAANRPQRTTVSDNYLVHSNTPNAPLSDCQVCSSKQEVCPVVSVVLDASQHTLHSFITHVIHGELDLEEPSISVGANLIYEHEDFESLAMQPLATWMHEGTAGARMDNGVPCARRQMLLTVDDLNGDSEWHVRVVDDPSAAQGTNVRVSGVTEARDFHSRRAEDVESQREAAAVPTETNENADEASHESGPPQSTGSNEVFLISEGDDDVEEDNAPRSSQRHPPESSAAEAQENEDGVLEID